MLSSLPKDGSGESTISKDFIRVTVSQEAAKLLGEAGTIYYVANTPAGNGWNTWQVYAELNRATAHQFLSMSINRPINVHDPEESFLDWTAKELAIKMTFDWDEKEATRIFQGLKEPLASRVMHYLLKLRGVS